MTGVQVVREPLYRTRPDCRTSFGDLAARVGTDLGLPPDAEQQVILDAIFAEKAPEIPRYRHVAAIGPRQAIKTSTLAIASMCDLFVLGVPDCIWSAHQSKTSSKSFEDMQRRILGNPDYSSLTCGPDGFRSGRGEESIHLPGTSVSLEFRARSGGSGRGFTTDRLTLDEALYLRAGDLGALLPTMLTRKGAQVRYASSAGMMASDALRSLRERGRGGSDPALFYVEYGAEPQNCEAPGCRHLVDTPGCALDDRELWWQAHPALWSGRIDEDAIADQRRALPPEEFMREFLTWWSDPPSGGGIMDTDVWTALSIGVQKQMASPTFAVEVALDRSVSTIGAAWQVNGRPHVEVIEDKPGTGWVVPRLAVLAERYGSGRPVVLDAGTAAAGLEPALEAAGLTFLAVTSAGRATACGAFYDAATSGALSHNGDPTITAAITAARWKDVGEGSRCFSRRRSAGDIAALYAVALAHHGLVNAPPVESDFYIL